MSVDLAASVQARLLARAKDRREDFNLILTRYAVERFLFRLSISEAYDQFWLKGALLFDLWFSVPHRPTRDADFLGVGQWDVDTLATTMRGICRLHVEDGMVFVPDSVRVEEIREDARYGGLRVRLVGLLGKARVTVQLDVGFGDAVTPGPEEIEYPVLLEDQPAPRLRAYPRATVAAEKIEAIVSLGMANSRMKDYFDLRALAKEGAIDSGALTEAIAATFNRRKTALSVETPLGLSGEFAGDAKKRAQWSAFLRKNKIDAPDFSEVVAEINSFAAEALRAAREQIKSE
ncbi:MAG: nucleotidyl transferase AbiEii/AbiGii toxin family protein [Burkholderiales bacterium]